MKKILCPLLLFALYPFAGFGQEAPIPSCQTSDKICILEELQGTIEGIEKESWRDKAYRELAKSYTYEEQEDRAITLINKIQNPDTKALTIRGIGFAAADRDFAPKRYAALFQKLTAEASKIDHPPSYGIALTYIAMAQAFAGDNAGATLTAKSMENDALRHKAFGETAEIQAERGDYAAATASIAHIDSLPFRNKAHRIVSKIFVQQGLIDEAYTTAQKIENAYMKAQALQLILNHDNPEEKIGKDSE